MHNRCPAHCRLLLRQHTGPTADEKATGTKTIVGGFSDSLTDPWSHPSWAPRAWERPWVGTRGNLRMDGNPTQVGGLHDEPETEDTYWSPRVNPWESENWEPAVYDQPSRISRALGTMRDGNPVMLGAIDPDVMDHFDGPKQDPWSLATKFSPRRYERPWIKSGLGTRADGNPAMVGALPGDHCKDCGGCGDCDNCDAATAGLPCGGCAECPDCAACGVNAAAAVGALPTVQRQAKHVMRAAKGLSKWAEKNRIPIGRAFIGTGDANAAGWTMYLPSQNDRIQVGQKAKALAVLHRVFQNTRGSDMGSGWFLVYFTDDPAAELAIAPDDAEDESTAGLEDGEVGFLKKLFGKKPKGIRRKISRLEKRLAKLRGKLEDMGEDSGDDEGDNYDDDLEGFGVGAAQEMQCIGRMPKCNHTDRKTTRGATRKAAQMSSPRSAGIRTMTANLPGHGRISQPFGMAGCSPTMLTQGVSTSFR